MANTATSAPSQKLEKESVWDFLSDSTLETDIDLEALLANRDQLIANNKGEKSSPLQSEVHLSGLKSTYELESSFPAFLIEEEEESWDFEEGVQSPVTYEDTHIDKLLKSYLCDEEDPQVKETLLEISNQKGKALQFEDATGNSEVGSDDEEGHHQSEGERDGDEEGGETENETENEKISRKVELYFQRRIRSQPHQVLRYAFEGEPLWITHPNPLGTEPYYGQKNPPKANKGSHKKTAKSQFQSIPRCELCGDERVFELQLMPALLSLLHPPEPSLNKGSLERNSKLSLEQLLGEGLDLGVLAVFSCRSSCDPGDRIATEIALVQPPPDI